MSKKFYYICVLFWVIPSGFAQLKTHTFEEAESLAKQNPKPYFVFIHTSWCKYCKMMEKTTFQNPEIIALLNESFYYIPFDAESKTDISFYQQVYHFKPTGNNTGHHELAYELGNMEKQLSFPAVCLLDTDYRILFQHNQFLKAKELKTILEKSLKK